MPTTFPTLDESSRRPTELREERGVSVIYLDGQWLDKESAKVSVFDHGLLYGDGVFEGMRVYNGKTFKLKQHIDRLYDSAQAIMLSVPD